MPTETHHTVNVSKEGSHLINHKSEDKTNDNHDSMNTSFSPDKMKTPILPGLNLDKQLINQKSELSIAHDSMTEKTFVKQNKENASTFNNE